MSQVTCTSTNSTSYLLLLHVLSIRVLLVELMSLGKMVSGGNEGSKEKQKGAESKVYTRKSFKGLKNISNASQHPQAINMALEDANLSQQLLGSSSLNRSLMLGNCGILAEFPRQENSVRISLSSRSKRDMRQLRSKLQSELDLVRSLVKKIEVEAKDATKTSSRTHNATGRQLMHSDVSKEAQLLETGPLGQLSVTVAENTRGANDVVEKEKRTPKANQFYRKSDFLLAKDKIPPAESNKKSKSSAKKVGGLDLGHGFGSGKFSNQVIKNCRALLERLMKNKHGWVFNQPVDTVGLGLHDYFDIIKNPMDLGTVKSRLETNWYKSPKVFADDVRLTFENAMTYNSEEQDVHMMAKGLLKTFDDKWASIEADYMCESRLTVDHEVSLPAPRSVKAPRPETKRTLERGNLKTNPNNPKPKYMHLPPSGRTPVPKKPKAKDPNKREMTYDEKQKLSTDLQNLSSEKLENVIQIIKKRSPSLCQQDEEIEVDIDSVDNETLWELDRSVTNLQKSLTKNKRKSILAFQARIEQEQNGQEKSDTAVVVEDPNESKATEEKTTSFAPAQVENQGNNAGGSSNSSSSSTDSGSSTDSDSESSSGGRSDTEHSPKAHSAVQM